MPIPFMGAVDPTQIQQQLASMRRMIAPADRQMPVIPNGAVVDQSLSPSNGQPAFLQGQSDTDRNPLLAAILGMSRAAASR